MFLGCSPGSQTEDKNLVNILHEKNNHIFMVKNVPIKLSTARCRYI